MADEYLEGIMNRQSPAMTAQDVAGVIAEKIRRRASFIQRWNNTSSPERHKTLEDEAVEAAAELIEVASLLESQAQALRAAERKNDVLTVGLNGAAERSRLLLRAKNDWMTRALAAESRLAEAMRVIEPFGNLADELEKDSLASEPDQSPAWCLNDTTLTFGHLRAARDFLNAAKEKTDAR